MKLNVKKIVAYLVSALYFLLILVAVLVAITLLPIKNNYKIYTVMSGSMKPAISVGSIVVVKQVNNYHVGDIITYKNSQQISSNDTTTHRIKAEETSGEYRNFVTKGDANNVEDADKIFEYQVIGKVYFSVPIVGYIFAYIKTLPGLMLLIFIPAIIIIYEEIKKIKKEAKVVLEKRKAKKRAKKPGTELLNGPAPEITEPLINEDNLLEKANKVSPKSRSATGGKGKGDKNA